jgi:hypothetical protein
MSAGFLTNNGVVPFPPTPMEEGNLWWQFSDPDATPDAFGAVRAVRKYVARTYDVVLFDDGCRHYYTMTFGHRRWVLEVADAGAEDGVGDVDVSDAETLLLLNSAVDALLEACGDEPCPRSLHGA